MAQYEFAELARYNSEKARGIQHTPEWVAKMEAEQERFDLAHALKPCIVCGHQATREIGGWGSTVSEAQTACDDCAQLVIASRS